MMRFRLKERRAATLDCRTADDYARARRLVVHEIRALNAALRYLDDCERALLKKSAPAERAGLN